MSESDRIRALSNDPQVVRLRNVIISQAINDEATEIQVDFQRDLIKVYYRVSDVLHHVMSPPGFLYDGLLADLKIIARMDILQHGPQALGTLRLVHDGRDLHLYFSTRPAGNGELMSIKLVWP